MDTAKVEERLAALEAEVAKLKVLLEETRPSRDPWMEHVWGAFANDPVFDEAMRLGRKYRESLRPKSRKKRKAAKTRKA